MTPDKNCIPINTLESRFSKSYEQIKSKKTTLSKGFSQCRTAKILASRLLGLSLQKSRYHIVWIERGLFEKHFQSAEHENYILFVCPKFSWKISLVISLHD